MTGKALGNNPLFQKSEPVVEREDVAQIEEPEEVDDYATMTFKVRTKYIRLVRNYAYTNRLEIKEAFDEILAKFFDNIDLSTLLDFPDRPKKTRKRG